MGRVGKRSLTLTPGVSLSRVGTSDQPFMFSTRDRRRDSTVGGRHWETAAEHLEDLPSIPPPTG